MAALPIPNGPTAGPFLSVLPERLTGTVMTRNIEQAMAWVEATLQGNIVNRRLQLRWRPQWFLDVRMPDGYIKQVMLRGWRAPGVVETEELSRARLCREAAVLELLDRTSISSPTYYGYSVEGGWILMEAVAGDELLTEVDDRPLQTLLFKQYVADIAALHKLDIAGMALPELIQQPENHDNNARWNYNQHRENFLANGAPADPLFEFAWWWRDRHSPAVIEKYSLCTGDIGANQFLFEGDAYRSLFDVEMAYVGDPIQDICLMR